MHAAIEEHERRRIVGESPADLATLIKFAAAEAANDGENIPKEWYGIHGDADKAVEWASQLTETWHESDVRQQLLSYSPLDVEPHIETETVPGPHSLRGYIDWIGRDAEGVATIIDYKSASNMKRWGNAEHHLVEAATYLWLSCSYEKFTPGEPVRMEWHVVSRKGDTRIVEGPYLDSDLSTFLFDRVNEANAIWDGMLFAPKPSWGLCSPHWCTFYHGCQVSGALSPEMVDFTQFSPDQQTSLPADRSGRDASNPSSLLASHTLPTMEVGNARKEGEN